MKKIFWKETLVTIGYLLVGFVLREVYVEVKGIHDDIIIIKQSTVNKDKYETDLAGIQAQLADVKTRITLIEVIQNKERNR